MSDPGTLEFALPDELEVNAVLEIVTRALERQEKDSEYLQGMQMAVPEAGKLNGVRVPQLSKIAKKITKKHH
ncbi:MAG: hypothetical protein WBB65_08665 [Anaerolineales bacterium]